MVADEPAGLLTSTFSARQVASISTALAACSSVRVLESRTSAFEVVCSPTVG